MLTCLRYSCVSFLILIGVAEALPAAPAFPLHTAGPYIVDAKGHRVRLNAVSWYGSESADFVVGGLQANTLANIVQQIKDAGFNAVRLPWSNQMFESNPTVGNYALAANPSLTGESALAIFDQVVNSLAQAGIMIILDNHSSNAEWCCSNNDGNTLWYNSTYPESSWISDWKAMAARYINQPYVIGTDLRNEPRAAATWGGAASTDWHAAAERGGNAVLSVNPNLLIFVEGVGYALNLSGAGNLPIVFNVKNQLVYSAHDYAFDHAGLTSYANWLNQIANTWGYLVTGDNPQPFWLGEFGTCNTAVTCVSSTNASDNGYWFQFITTYLASHSLDWSYWALNGTQSTGRTWGSLENYGILNMAWDNGASTALSAAMQTLESSTGGPANGTYKALNVNSGLAMDLTGGSIANGTGIEQWSYWQGPNQKWVLTNIGAGVYEITNVDSGLALDIRGQSAQPGAAVQQWSYWGGGNQQYVITEAGNGTAYQIVNSASGLVVEVPASSTMNGTALDIQPLNGGENQQWNFGTP